MRLRGGGRSWIRKTVKAASKKERQRKKRNIDNTNLRASVKLDPASVPPALLLQTELEHQAEQWLLGGCRPEALPTVEPLKAIEAAKLRLQAMPDKPPRAPRTIKDRQAEEDDAMRVDADDRGDGDDVGSKGSRSIRPGRGLNSAASSRKAAHIKQGPRSNGKRGGMRLRGGAPGDSEDESSSVVSDDSSSVVSSSSSSAFALPVATNLPAKRSTAAEDARTRASEPPPRSPAPPASASTGKQASGIGDLSEELSHLGLGKRTPRAEPAASVNQARADTTTAPKAGRGASAAPTRRSDAIAANEPGEDDSGGFEMASATSSQVSGPSDEDQTGASSSGEEGLSDGSSSERESSADEELSSSTDDDMPDSSLNAYGSEESAGIGGQQPSSKVMCVRRDVCWCACVSVCVFVERESHGIGVQ
jgi:hypothetical protein